jgi:hypothetical protein
LAGPDVPVGTDENAEGDEWVSSLDLSTYDDEDGQHDYVMLNLTGDPE